MNLELIGQILNQAGLGTVGEQIFFDAMPADVGVGILLRNPLEGVPEDPNLPGFYKSTLQAIVRAVDHAEGKTRSAAVRAALTINDRRIPETGALQMRIAHLYPAQRPIVYPRSDGDGLEFSLNFKAHYNLPF